jgi:hypothetical protein
MRVIQKKPARPNLSNMRQIRTLVVSLLGLCILASHAAAQVDRSALGGQVTDESGAAVGGAQVAIRNPHTGLVRETRTGGEGLYAFPAVPVGAYDLTVAKDGFSTSRTSGVVLGVGQTRTVDVQLKVGPVATQIEIAAEATPLDQATADIGLVVGARQIHDIPINGRNWSFLMALAPGAINTGDGTQNSIRFFGRYRDENYWTFDGVDATGIKDPRQEGGLRLVLSLDAISEFKVNSSSYTAETGTSAGSQINLVSRSGTNDYRGSLFWFVRNDRLDARRPFDPPNNPDFRLNQFGANLGGRIVRDRTFFFANYEGLRQRLGQAAVSGLTPSALLRERVAAASPALAGVANAFPLGHAATADPLVDRFVGVFRNRWEENAGSIRVDHRLTQNNHLFFRFNTTDGSFNDRRSALLESRESLVRPTNATAQWQTTLTSRIVNEFKFGFNRSALTRPQAGLLLQAFTIPGLTTTQASTAIYEKPNSWTLSDNLSWLRGRHTLKFGGEARRIQLNAGDDGAVSVRFASLDAFINNRVDRFEVAGVLPMFGGRRTLWQGYVQDEWRALPNLTLTIGARYEYYTVMTEVNGRGRVFDDIRCQGFCPPGAPWYFPDRNNIAPRFGFAYNAGARTVIRGGYGIYYGPGQQDDVTAAIDSEPERFQLTAAQRPGLSFPILPFLAEARSLGAQPRALQRDRQDFYSQQWSFSIQRALPASFVLQSAYVGNRGSHLFGRDRVNLPLPGTNIRPLPAFSDIDRKNNFMNSTFHGWQNSLQRNFTRGWLFQLQYMFSKAIDDNAGSGDGAEIMISSCRRCERAVADFDIRHTTTINSVFELPFGPGRHWGPKSGIAGKFMEGWDLSGMFTARTGRPFTPVVDRATADVPDTNARNQRAQLTGLPHRPEVQLPDQWVARAAFAPPARGTWGDAPRNMLRAPGLWQADAALNKRTRLAEGKTLEFRAEAFNLFNRSQFGTPLNNWSNVNFGRVLSTANDGATGFGTSRMLQFMLRLNF